MTTRTIIAAWVILWTGGGAMAKAGEHARLKAVPFTDVTINDDFWSPRLDTNRTVTLAHNLRQCRDTGRIANFARAAGLEEGAFQGAFFNDSDVYKVLEGAAYTLAEQRDPKLEAQIDRIIDLIAAAQQDDGYLNTYYTLVEPDKRWTDLDMMHELYCAGHMFEGAVAYYNATGKRKWLDVACRFADHIAERFAPGKRVGYPGHEEIELGLVKLYRATGNERYRDLAEFFIEVRGQQRQSDKQYMQAHLPVAEQSEIVGHAVRAMYLYSGVADVAALTGNAAYLDAMERLWANVTGKKMYLTGGIGASHTNEGFSGDYELPNDAAYCETCASIGMCLWNHRLLMLHGQARFADVLERAMYNGVLSGVSLEGSTFFYVNPLASRGNHHRKPFYATACCPTNIVRFIPSIGGYIYATSDDGAWVNLYIGSEARMEIAGAKLTLTQKTDYPWSGRVTIKVEPASPIETTIHLRVPGWCHKYDIQIAGEPIPPAERTVRNGYLALHRRWSAGDTIEVDWAMPIERIEANPQVEDNRSRIALQRGPLVYCLEAVDNGGKVRNLALPRDAKLQLADPIDIDTTHDIVTITAHGLAGHPEPWEDHLYRPAAEPREVPVTAVPYCLWDNRDAGEMVVWIPEAIGLVDQPPPPSRARGAKVTASHVWDKSVLEAVNDGYEPESSHDANMPRFLWYPHRGTAEWIAYTFERPMVVTCVEVYWWDDGLIGGICRAPASWRLLYKDGDAWKPVTGASPYGNQRGTWNRVTFDSIATEALKIEVQLKDDRSGGILEWRIP